MVRLFLLQILKHQIHRVLEILIVLTDLHCIDEFDERGKVLFRFRCLIVDIADEGTVEKCLRFVPERISALAVTLGVCHKRRCQLQDILFAVQIGKRVIVHGLVEIDRVENLDPVICMHKCMTNLEQGRTFRVSEHI